MTWIQASLPTTVSNDVNNCVHFMVPAIKASAALCFIGLCVSAAFGQILLLLFIKDRILSLSPSFSHSLPLAGFAVQPVPWDSNALTRCFPPFPGEKAMLRHNGYLTRL